MNKKLIISLAIMAAGVGVMVAQSIKAREEEAKRNQRLAESDAALDEMTETLTTLLGDLDKKLETAKFWDIVTRNA